MQGMTFIEAAKFLYNEHNVVLFSIHKASDPNRPILNPGNLYTLSSGERGYVVSLNRGESMKITNLSSNAQILISSSTSNLIPSDKSVIELQVLPPEEIQLSEYLPRTSLDSIDDKTTTIHFDEPRNLTESLLYNCDAIGEWKEILYEYSNDVISQEDACISNRQSRSQQRLNPSFDEEDGIMNNDHHHSSLSFSDHIIVYGNSDNLISFISPLRVITNMEQPAIIIISKCNVPDSVWNIIGRFSNIYVSKVFIQLNLLLVLAF